MTINTHQEISSIGEKNTIFIQEENSIIRTEFNNEQTNSINQNVIIENNCDNLFYYNIDNNKINCLSFLDKICPEDYPYKFYNDNECHKYPMKYNNKWVNFIPDGTCINPNISNLDICIDTNETINELGGFCIYNKTNIISNIKQISESENSKIDLSEWVSLFIYTNKDNIYNLSGIYQNISFIELGNCVNILINLCLI